jgi:hypothetical protein
MSPLKTKTMPDCTVVFNGQKVGITDIELSYDATDLPNIRVDGILLSEIDKFSIERDPDKDVQRKLNEIYKNSVQPTFRLNELNSKTLGFFRREYLCDWKDEDMSCDSDVIRGGCEESPQELSRKVVELDLESDERLLRKYNVVNLDGTLTETGRILLLNVIFEENREEVIEKLEELEKQKKHNKSNCSGC